MKKYLAVLAAACAVGGVVALVTTQSNSPPKSAPPSACPQAANGHGQLGICAPKRYGLAAPHAVFGPQYPDRSNNDPCYCGAAIRAAGQVGLIAKSNQGASYIDPTAVGMIQSARAAGLAVGLYDFDQDYTVTEARLFVARLHAAGIYPTTPNTFPAYLDVEYGSFSYPGLLTQIAYLHSQGYRVGIYTGDWYWGPHAGCRWPSGLVSAWLSGYPNAPIPCGTTNYNAHQYTSTPVDLTVFLGSLAQFHTFVHILPPPPLNPICFHKRETKAQCAAVKAQIASAQRAAASSQRALDATDKVLIANKCRKPYRRGVCVHKGHDAQVFSQRVRWFTAHAAALRAAN